MSKSFLLASGIFACILGVEMLVVDSAVLADGKQSVRAPDWAPWTLLSVGAAIVLQFWHGSGASQSTAPDAGATFGRPR